MEYKDYYKILGVDRSAGKDDLKKKYRKLARQYHPDVNTTDKDAGARFAEISEAYEVLSDDEKRKKYDVLGSDWERYQNAGQGDQFDWSKYSSQGNGGQEDAGRDWGDVFGNGSDASDFFRNIFGQGFGRPEGARAARKGQDLRAELAISLEEAYRGGKKILNIGDREIRLALKPGIWDGQTIKIAGKGAAGAKGEKNGDLYLSFMIQGHPDYLLEGIDLFKEISVNLYAAVLGTAMDVQTISGTFKIKIRGGTKNGTMLKLKGKGFPVYSKPGSHGDLYLKVAVRMPEDLTEKEKSLFRELAAIRQEKVEEETA